MTYENIISDHLLEYIDDDRLLNLNVSTIYRIIQKFQQNQHNDENTDKVIEFLIRYIDKHGRPASILFSLIEFDHSKIEYLNTLVTKYSKIIDFHFLNSNLLAAIYEKVNKAICGEFMDDERYKSAIQKLAETEKVNGELKSEIESLKKKQEEQEKLLNKMGEMIQQINTDNQKKVDELVGEINQLKQKVTEMSQLNSTIEQLKSSYQSKTDELQREINSLKQMVYWKTIPYSGDEQSGIISYLIKKLGNGDEFKNALKLTGGGFPHPLFPITNLIKYGDTSTYYYNASSTPQSESDAWIEFDFVQNKINLTSYTIQTYGDSHNSRYKPKTWRIVGSNDHEKWTVLNRQVNSPHLNDEYKQHRFECEKTNNFYRYIRYIQEDSWNSSDCKYSFSFTCFELFGSILD